jgi:hypothetical protein
MVFLDHHLVDNSSIVVNEAIAAASLPVGSLIVGQQQYHTTIPYITFIFKFYQIFPAHCERLSLESLPLQQKNVRAFLRRKCSD